MSKTDGGPGFLMRKDIVRMIGQQRIRKGMDVKEIRDWGGEWLGVKVESGQAGYKQQKKS